MEYTQQDETRRSIDQNVMSPVDYLAVLQQRKWALMVPALAVMVVAMVVALNLPAVYRSTATIMIEEQEVPDDFVKATVTSYAEERIQTIHQWIMSSTRLLGIINRFDLYADLRDTHTTDELVARMRRNTHLEMINAEVIDPRSGRPAEATIAFSLSYQGKASPKKIQQVANELTSLFLERNLSVRVQQTRETRQFLENEMIKVKSALDLLEAKIAIFKEKNIKTLPELLQVNTQSLNNIERRIDMLETQLRATKEREGYLQTQLVNVSPKLEARQQNSLRLEQLRVQQVELKSRFTNAYPDVIKVTAEIANLERKMASDKDGADTDKELPDNPAYITLASQLSSTRAEIQSL
ncbi:MAG: hypothetical protein PVJ19_22185, partial [Desulfobacteraceae bacterium]